MTFWPMIVVSPMIGLSESLLLELPQQPGRLSPQRYSVRALAITGVVRREQHRLGLKL